MNFKDIKFKKDKQNDLYWCSYTINNKSCLIVFYENKTYNDITNKRNVIYDVGFAVGKNRKQCFSFLLDESDFLENKISGNGNLSYLIFAYKAIIAFEKFIVNESKGDNVVICVSGMDERRYKVYEYYLKKIGYKPFKFNSKKWSAHNKVYKNVKGVVYDI